MDTRIIARFLRDPSGRVDLDFLSMTGAVVALTLALLGLADGALERGASANAATAVSPVAAAPAE
ncbi:hypothetical protein [Jannaschia sp. W003]|uniref:hypothetical protein n=1 Tax=Jannaschia sp. W003 TaxID=2867012 RepID=UPI0021A5ED15|nr:hypothetical protein [Jannaschia sp. W003]UWQ20332.1 hypothetical protein K3554_10015 [Jannaschia sp. W003]